MDFYCASSCNIYDNKKSSSNTCTTFGSIAGGIYGAIFQPDIIHEISGNTSLSGFQYVKNSYIAIINSMTIDVNIQTSNIAVNDLISTSGMSGMLNTIWLIICAMSFGGIMEKTGFLNKITSSLLEFVSSQKSLFLTTSGTCYVFKCYCFRSIFSNRSSRKNVC